MTFDDLTDRVTRQVDALRDRTAEAIRAEGESFFKAVREVDDNLERRLEGLERRLTDQVERRADEHRDELERLGTRRTSWPRRAFWLLAGAGAGLVAAYLADPDRGRARRAQLGDQLAAQARDTRDQAKKQARFSAGRARGSVIETAKQVLPDDIPDDPRTLEQRIRSEVFGHRDDTTDVVIRVDGPGRVALKGTVPDHDSERDLLSSVAEVEGVIDLTSELQVASDR